MKYNIYIDESGSINDHNRGIFEVAMVIMPEQFDKRARKYYRKHFRKFKINNKLPISTELKAHFLIKNNQVNFLEGVFEDVRQKNKIVSGYIDNRRTSNSIQKRTKDQKFYHMINLMIQRAISRKYINNGDEINILCDKRNALLKEISKLSNNSLNKHNINIIDFKFIDSKKDIMIQVADIVSAKCFRMVMNKLSKNIPYKSKSNLSIREIFY